MHITNSRAGSAAVEESSMPATTGAELQNPVVEEEEISLEKKAIESYGISKFEADISMEDATSLSSGYITMEWRGQQHASKAVESTASSHITTCIITNHQLSSDQQQYHSNG